MSASVNDLFDVAIVGYGPVGQALAIALAQHGHRVLVVERWPEPYALPRAVSYDHETARILQSLGVAEAASAVAVAAERYEWRNAAGRVLLAFDGLDRMALSGWPDRLGFCQPELERVLDARVRSFTPQVTVLQGWTVMALHDGGEHVTLQAQATGSAGEPAKEFAARYVVGCDGASSFVRAAMGSDYQDLGFSADWLVVDVQPNDPSRWSNALVQVCDPARPTTDVMGGPARRRLEFMRLPGETLADMNTAETAWRLLGPIGWHAGNATLERHAVYTFRGCLARTWRAGRVLLAGDAAHLTPPFAGQGLCAGLRDAMALAWRLDLVLRGRARADLLDSYGEERAVHARRFIDFAIELGNVICVLDPAAAAGRDAFMLGEGANVEAKFPDAGLPASGLVRTGDAHAGALSMQARVGVDGRIGRFDDLVGGGFVLLGLDHDPAAALDASQRDFLGRLGVRAVGIGSGAAVDDVDGDYRRWFGQLGCRAVLTRPDFYLFGAGEARTLVEALQRCEPFSGPRQARSASRDVPSSRASADLSFTPSLR